MDVRAQLDDDSTAMDPVGSITLIGDDGAEIVDPATLLDAWFTGLFALLDTSWPASIDLVDEPDPLTGRAEGEACRVSYGGQSILVSSTESLLKAVERECSRILGDLRDRTPRGEQWPQILAELEHRLARTAV